MIRARITLREANILWQQFMRLQQIGQQIGIRLHSKLAYWLSRNQQKLKPVIDSLADSDKANTDYQKYLEERKSLGKDFSKKDDKGNPLVSINGSVDIEDMPGFANALNELSEKYKETIEKRDAFFETEEEIEFFEIDLDLFPEEFDYSFMSVASIFIIDKPKETDKETSGEEKKKD